MGYSVLAYRSHRAACTSSPVWKLVWPIHQLIWQKFDVAHHPRDLNCLLQKLGFSP